MCVVKMKIFLTIWEFIWCWKFSIAWFNVHKFASILVVVKHLRKSFFHSPENMWERNGCSDFTHPCISMRFLTPRDFHTGNYDKTQASISLSLSLSHTHTFSLLHILFISLSFLSLYFSLSLLYTHTHTHSFFFFSYSSFSFLLYF